MKKWELLKQDIENETKRILAEEPEELRVLRAGELDNKAGSYGQYWTTLDFANGMIRDYSMYTMYPILKLAYEPNNTLDHLKNLITVFHPPYTEYLGYSGYETMKKFDRTFRECLDTGDITTKDEFIRLYRSYLIYTNKLAAWSYHYFPWEIGFDWKQKAK
jgi:hypothetical protein